jgi:3-hydroxyisobutyrate dehydrogenase-like beta-hydroxyacid dehydrogenase
MCEVVKAYKQGLNEGRKEARELQRHLDNYAKRWLARGEEQDKKIKRLREALDLMVDTYKNGGWPTATIEIAKSALQESSVQEANDE